MQCDQVVYICLQFVLIFYIHVQIDHFNICVNTEGMMLPDLGIFVVWKWKWLSDNDSNPSGNEESESELECQQEHNHYLQCDSETESEPEFVLPSQTHIVTFKCIGSTHAVHAQETLE